MSDILPQSPDLRQLVDLTLYDSSITDLITQMQSDAPMKLPGWAPTTADPAETFLETNALCTAFLAFAINRLPGAITQILLTLFQVFRNLGVQATATATITAIGAGGYTVPAGTRLGLAQNSGPSLAFVTTVALSIPPGSTSAVVPIIASAVGAGPNGTQAGTALSILDPINYLISAVLATPVGGGANAESNISWLTRGIQALGRLTLSLTLPSQFVQAALATVGPYRVDAVERLSISMRPPNPNYHGRDNVRAMVEGANVDLAQVILSGEHINTQEAIIREYIDHASEYGNVSARARRGPLRIPWTSKTNRADQERIVTANQETGEVDPAALRREAGES